MSPEALCEAQKKHLDTLIEDYETVLEQMSSTLEDEAKSRLERRADILERQIARWEEKVAVCQAGHVDATYQERVRVWEEHISDIDFTEAFHIVQEIINELKESNGGAALFLLQNTNILQGRWCIRRLRDQLQKMTVNFKPYPIGPTASSRMDASTFLSRMGEHLECEAPSRPSGTITDDATIKDYVRHIRQRLQESLTMGSIVYLEIRTGVTLAYQSQFLSWFLDEFWGPLIRELPNIHHSAPSVSVIGVVTSHTSLDSDYLQSIPCCTLDDFDACQFLELPLRFWEEAEIRDWLIRFSGLKPHHIEQQDIGRFVTEMANAIYLMSNNGQPIAVYDTLIERLTQFYETP
jgi:hypothetical protein